MAEMHRKQRPPFDHLVHQYTHLSHFSKEMDY